jgi:hypothetical protein
MLNFGWLIPSIAENRRNMHTFLQPICDKFRNGLIESIIPNWNTSIKPPLLKSYNN